MRLCCLLNGVPGWIRMFGGIITVLVGLPVLIMPIPLGLIIIFAGLTLIISAFQAGQQHLIMLKKRVPVFYRVLRPLFERCESCKPTVR